MGSRKVVTLNEFIIQSQKGFPFATGELSGLLLDICLAAKIVNREVNKAGLVDILGLTGDANVHGEDVKKLDVFAHEVFIDALSKSGACGGIASEESEGFISVNDAGKYVVCIDPLDGSSNIDVNVSIGTIFSILRRKTENGPCEMKDFLQKGCEQVAAGYVIYGSSTMLVYTTGVRVNGFTLDPSIGEFCLSHRDIKMPKQGKIYSINECYRSKFPSWVNDFVDYCKEDDPSTGRPFSSRYIGSMVADFHRNLIKGGVFMYPDMTTHPNGKLRVLYECNPMSFIIEIAGGQSLNHEGKRILDIQPKKLHQRTPVFMGSLELMDTMKTFTSQMVDAK